MIYQHLSAKKSELDKLPVLPADAQEELRKKVELEIAYVGGGLDAQRNGRDFV